MEIILKEDVVNLGYKNDIVSLVMVVTILFRREKQLSHLRLPRKCWLKN